MIVDDLKNIPIEQALKEYRLNIEHQYGEGWAYLLVDVPIMALTNKVALECMTELMQSLNKTKGGKK